MKQKFYWTEEKVSELKNIWNTKSLYKIAAYFHTTEETIREKASEIGLEEYKSNRWTKEEEEILREYSEKYVTKTIAKKLGRSYLAVQKKAVKLGIELHSTPDPWKKWMINYLKDNINKQPIGQIESMIGLSYHSILTKCKELGIEYVKESWTEEEIKILREYADKCHYTELTKVLPNRTIGAIAAKAYELGIETISTYTKLDDKQIKYIKDNWGEIPATEIARNLKISIGILNRYKKELNLPNTGQQKKWTEDKISKLRKDAKTKTRNELAKKYKTSPAQISTIARKNNIKLINSRKKWTKELENQLSELYSKGLTISEISQELGLQANTIRVKIRELFSPENIRDERTIWSFEEEEKLKILVEEYTIKQISVVLNKTEYQIKNKVNKMGLEVKKDGNCNWTEEETRKLRKLALNHDFLEISHIMNRAEITITRKAKELGIELIKPKHKRWTKEDEELLIRYSKEYTIKEISHIMKRTTASINGKLKELGLNAQVSSKFWTEEEETLLISLSETHSAMEIAKKMNKSYESVINKMYKLNLKNITYNGSAWTEEENNILLELLETNTTFEIAKILNRSEESIRVNAKKLGYVIDGKHKAWTKQEEEILSDLWGSKSVDYISTKLNRSVSGIINRAFILELGSQIKSNYDGISISEISDIFLVSRETILTKWVILGLKLDYRKRSNSSTYSYVTISNLYDFLEKNQNIWDSRNLEINILGSEPEWLKEKRKSDQKLENGIYKKSDNITKLQLLREKKYYLELNEKENDKSVEILDDEKPNKLINRANNI